MMFLHNLVAQSEKPGGMLNLIDRIARIPISQIVIFFAACTIIRIAIYPYLAKTPVLRRDSTYRSAKILNEFIDAVAYATIFVFLIIRPYFGQTFNIPTGSMLNTIQLGDFIVANKYSYRFGHPVVGDIVVFWPPEWGFLGDDHSIPYIKRCVGIPGDIVEVKDGHLHRNGHRIAEKYLLEPTSDYDFKLVEHNGEPWPLIIHNTGYVNYEYHTAPKYRVDASDYALMDKLKASPSIKIPKDHYLMMGDNRNGSYDGRSWGLVPKRNIIAQSEFTWLPLNRIGWTK
jgi:signal peptidase I